MKFPGIFGLFSVAQLVSAHYNSAGSHGYRQSDTYDKSGAVASENAVCSRIGIDLIVGRARYASPP